MLIKTTNSAGNINNAALHLLNKTSLGHRNNFNTGQSSSCSTLPSFHMDSSEDDSVFELQTDNNHTSKIMKGKPNDDTQHMGKSSYGKYHHVNRTDTCESEKQDKEHAELDNENAATLKG